LKLLHKDMPLPTPLGLEKDGTVLLKPYCPPYYRNMQDAVLAFVAEKFAAGRGTFRDGGAATGWLNPASIQAGIPEYSDRTFDPRRNPTLRCGIDRGNIHRDTLCY
jgi:hypothetical protein